MLIYRKRKFCAEPMRERLTFHFELRTQSVNFRFFFLFFFSFFLFFQIKARSRLVTEVALFWEVEDASFDLSVYRILIIYGITVSEQYVVDLSGLPYFWGYFMKPCCFSIFFFFFFFCTESSSSCVNCHSLMSNSLLIILVIGLCVTFRGFPSKFSKCCFDRCIRPCWLAAFSLAWQRSFFYSLRLPFAMLS